MSQKGYSIVTGGSRGIGAALCEQLAAEGYDVLVNYSASKGRAEEVANRINQQYGVKAAIFQANVKEYEQVEAMRDFAKETFGDDLSVLVNNAGLDYLKPFLDLTPAEYENIIDVDYIGTLNCCHVFGPMLIERKKGNVITIASTAAFRAAPHAAYCGAKAAQVAFNRQLAVEWGPHGIRCNVIAPGYTITEASEAVGPQILEMVRNQSPLKVVGTVEDMKLALSYLLSAEKMTGTTISPNCGVFSF